MLTKEQRDTIRAQTLRVIERDGGYTNGTGDTLAILDALDEMERERDEAHRYLLQLLEADAHARSDVTRYLMACCMLP